jgi:hypothetical protein
MKMIGTRSANFDQGQRSCAPRKQAGHMSALDQLAETSKNLLRRTGRPHMGTIASPWRHDFARDSTPSYPMPCSSLPAYSEAWRCALFRFKVL